MEGFIVLFIILFLALFIVPMVFFLLQLQKLLNNCAPQNRIMEPGMVWLNIIPLFGMVWIFFTVIKIRDSLKGEFASRNLESDDPEFGFMMGLIYAITGACSIIPFIGTFAAIASIVFWIIYWIKMNKYCNILINNPGSDNAQLDS